MKIGYLAAWWPEFGGSYQYDLFAISALRKVSPSIEIIVFYSDDRLRRDLAHLRSEVKFVKVVDRLSSRGVFPLIVRGALKYCYRIANIEPIAFANRELRKHKLDVCIATAPFIDGVFANCPNVLIVHDLWFLRNRSGGSSLSQRELRTQIGIWNSDVFVVESPLGKHHLVEYGKVDKRRVKIVALPTAPFVTKYMEEKLRPLAIASKPYVFYPAHYWDFKNHAVTLRALRLLRSKGIFLSAVFCGAVSQSTYRDMLIRMTAEFDLQSQVVFEEWLPDCDVAALYQHAAAVVMSSKLGPTNMPIWEGMAFGTPVISCDVGDMPWQVGDAGLIFPVDDERVLASHLESIMRDSELAKEYVRRGKQKFASLRTDMWGEGFFNVVKEAIALNHEDRAVAWKESDLRYRNDWVKTEDQK